MNMAHAEGTAFTHPGMLSKDIDFTQAKALIAAKTSPAIDSWNMLQASRYADANYQPNAVPQVVRGNPSWGKDNYAVLFRDAAAAYQLAIRWKISGDSAYADASIKVLDDWSNKLTNIIGTSDKYLASGIYGYQSPMLPRS